MPTDHAAPPVSDLPFEALADLPLAKSPGTIIGVTGSIVTGCGCWECNEGTAEHDIECDVRTLQWSPAGWEAELANGQVVYPVARVLADLAVHGATNVLLDRAIELTRNTVLSIEEAIALAEAIPMHPCAS
jgi:hypothetical protein